MSGNAKKTVKADNSFRTASVKRSTTETQITCTLTLDGQGMSDVKTPYVFLTHMFHLFARHGNFDLQLSATGDLPHHILEDVAIVLGQTLEQALGDKKGIERYGEAQIPMDESLASCVIDLSGRAYFVGSLGLEGQHVEDVATEDLLHFFETLANHAKMNLHLRVLYGSNNHHKVEACFKALAHALRKAVRLTGESVLSTKGTLT
jgi:imidazoleglycerol-phosphate dehydratase